MGTEGINDVKKWSEFVAKLLAKTQTGELKWADYRSRSSRERLEGAVFVAEFVKSQYVAVYRYSFDYYTDVDIFEVHKDVAIELVKSTGERLWRLPEVPLRFELIDHIEFNTSGAQGALDTFLAS